MFDLIPLFIYIDIFQAEVCTQINDLRLGQDLLVDQRCTKSLRRCRKDHIYLICQLFHIVIHALCIYDLEHIPVYICILLIHIASGTIPFNFCIFMSH